jgi:predicted metal-dependent hydrolase
VSYERGLELIVAGAYFEAHEDLELAWRAAPQAERDFLQGLVHVTVAWYQAGRGNRVGCERQLEKARRRLGPYAPAHRGLDVAATLASVEQAAALVQGGSLALPPPAIRSDVEPDETEEAVEVDPQPPEAVEEEERAEHDEDRAADELDRDVVVADAAEDAHGRDEERSSQEKRHG